MILRINNCSYSYADTTPKVVSDIDYSLTQPEIISLIGVSGSGKSTLLRLISGQLTPSSGNILFRNKEIPNPSTALVPGHREIIYQKQLPHFTAGISVYQNIDILLRREHPEIRKKLINELLELFKLETKSNLSTNELSGGQQQRLMLAMALATKPEIVLLDEPFSGQDNITLHAILDDLINVVKTLKTTLIMATHDVQLSLAYSDTLWILDQGNLIEKNSPTVLYNSPIYYETACLLGKCSRLPKGLFTDSEHYFVRPEQVKLTDVGIKAIVRDVKFMGAFYLLKLEVNNEVIYMNYFKNIEVNTEIEIKFDFLSKIKDLKK